MHSDRIVYKGIEWINKQGALIPHNPPHIVVNLTMKEKKELLDISKAFFIRWHSSFDTEKSKFWYVVKDHFGDFDELSSNTRSKVRRGKKYFDARTIKKEELMKKGYEVYREASKRYKTFEHIMSENEYIEDINSLDEDKYQFWGVHEKQTRKLVGYSQNHISDNACFYEEIFYHPDYLKKYSSYLLFFDMNRYYLEKRSFFYVHDGSRNLSHNTQIHNFLIHKFKFREAYCDMSICYRNDVKIAVRILYPFRFIIGKCSMNICKKISVLLKHEEIRRGIGQ